MLNVHIGGVKLVPEVLCGLIEPIAHLLGLVNALE